LLHWSALVAHAPASVNAFAWCGDSRAEPAAIAVARTRFRSTIIDFPVELHPWPQQRFPDRQEQHPDPVLQRTRPFTDLVSTVRTPGCGLFDLDQRNDIDHT
jgi:hypothetical protein